LGNLVFVLGRAGEVSSFAVVEYAGSGVNVVVLFVHRAFGKRTNAWREKQD
jgi:hypothetical protein